MTAPDNAYIGKEPSLPGNLDDAAKRYFNKDHKGYNPEGCVIASFKAGAEWMAGQGVKARKEE